VTLVKMTKCGWDQGQALSMSGLWSPNRSLGVVADISVALYNTINLECVLHIQWNSPIPAAETGYAREARLYVIPSLRNVPGNRCSNLQKQYIPNSICHIKQRILEPRFKTVWILILLSTPVQNF